MAGITINEVAEALRTEHAAGAVEERHSLKWRNLHGCSITPARCSHHEHCEVCDLLDRADGRDVPKREERTTPDHGGSRAEGPMFGTLPEAPDEIKRSGSKPPPKHRQSPPPVPPSRR